MEEPGSRNADVGEVAWTMASVRMGATKDARGKLAEDVGANAKEVASGAEESPVRDANRAAEEDMAAMARVRGPKSSDSM
jgi:hypothetical protein